MKKHKLTWIDGLLIALILLLIAGTCVKFLYHDPLAGNSDLLRFKVSATGIRKESVDLLRVGDPVYESNGKTYLGKIADVQVSPAVSRAEYSDGTIHEVTVEGRYDLVITIESQGTDKGNYYQIGTFAVRPNRPGVCYNKYTAWMYSVLSLG